MSSNWARLSFSRRHFLGLPTLAGDGDASFLTRSCGKNPGWPRVGRHTVDSEWMVAGGRSAVVEFTKEHNMELFQQVCSEVSGKRPRFWHVFVKMLLPHSILVSAAFPPCSAMIPFADDGERETEKDTKQAPTSVCQASLFNSSETKTQHGNDYLKREI